SNAYRVRFARFGEATVSRTVQPQMYQYLYDLSASDGADNTWSDTHSGDQVRNGEPLGELGLITHVDNYPTANWHDQTGAPNQPQAGNLPGGKRDVLRSASYGPGDKLGALVPVNGNFVVAKTGGVQASPTAAGQSSFAIFNDNAYLPNYFEITAQASVGKPTGGSQSNAFIIFDYVSATNFKFAGIDGFTNKIEIGHYDAGSNGGVGNGNNGWVVDTQTPFQIQNNQTYGLFLALNGNIATLIVNNSTTITFTFPWHVVDGVNFGLNYGGIVGIGSNNATSTFNNIVVQVPSPQTTFTYTETFTGGTEKYFAPTTSGTWTAAPAGGAY